MHSRGIIAGGDWLATNIHACHSVTHSREGLLFFRRRLSKQSLPGSAHNARCISHCKAWRQIPMVHRRQANPCERCASRVSGVKSVHLINVLNKFMSYSSPQMRGVFLERSTWRVQMRCHEQIRLLRVQRRHFTAG